MIEQERILVTLIRLIDRVPMMPTPKRGPGQPNVYADRLFLKALVIMIVRHLHTVHELLTVLAQPMHHLRQLLTVNGQFPSRRTWERRLQTLPATLPAQIGCLGRLLVGLLQPWAQSGRAVAIDSTVLRPRGGVWHHKDRTADI